MAYINQVKRHNLHLRLDLPANAPEGYPHIIDLEAINENDLPNNLETVDVIATVLYKWDPEALQYLLDLTKNDFHFGHLTASQYETYIIRDGRHVRVGAIEKDEYLSTPYPDFEVEYRIQPTGKWVIIGGRGRVRGTNETYSPKDNEDDLDSCIECETMIASRMLIRRIWERDLSVDFRYEVDGKDKVAGEEDSEDSCEGSEEGGEGKDDGGREDEVEEDPESNDSSSTEIEEMDVEPKRAAGKPRHLLMECGF